MILELIDHLKDPQLVATIQEFFGVKIYYDKYEEFKSNKTTKKTEKREHISIDHNEENHILTCHNQKMNGCNTNGSKTFNRCIEQMELLKQQKNESMNKEETLTVSENPHYAITNSFWYYLFLFGTKLGDEIFYSSFIPFLFWNIDGAVGRKVVLVWAIVFTIGQGLKDMIHWPRPACPPAVRLQNKWSQEYGMPSTHAMIGFAIPFSIVLFTMNKYIYSSFIGYFSALVWCILVSMSRLYLGMHTVLDIVVGLILTILLMIPLVPLVDITNSYIITSFWLSAILIMVSIAVIVYYPLSDKWTPTSDTAMAVSVTAGIYMGAWLNYYTGILSASLVSPPYHIVWPTYSMLGHLILRTVLGLSIVFGTRVLCKYLSYTAVCAILQINCKELMKCQDYNGNRNKVFVNLIYKYVACFMIGLITVYFLPRIFSTIGIERPAFYTEI
ncbi:sphingosine-1-phosphate phosphatase 2-like isoform X2 [Cataglyphis hispanica]|uniref:sphingosine-1-phosphate phosphatase 2-like isoform X2 n=1 Tax=Cataglyphis hispanica TaxID=1086592 RepID=UPI00217F6AD6|nr:sphingosine-1-phosphate phosphatase 2-like isoform X2 [Cataglyphis hispanica]